MDFWKELLAAKLAPPPKAAPVLHVAPAGADLLPCLIEHFRRATDAASAILADAYPLSLLSEVRRKGAQLTWGIPAHGSSSEAVERRMPNRLVYWQRGITRDRRVGLLSSRLGRRLEARKQWFDALRTTCARLDPLRDVLVTARETATDRYIRRCGELYGLRVLDVILPSANQSPSDWFRSVVRSSCSGEIENCVFVGPQFKDDSKDLPLRDEFVLSLSVHSIALMVRQDGNLHRMLMAHLDRANDRPGSIYVAAGEGLTNKCVAAELLDAGAVGWMPIDKTVSGDGSTISGVAASEDQTDPDETLTRAPPIRRLPFDSPWPYLSHWTRPQDGPWPGETHTKFLDDLILNRPAADHSALAALARIVAQRRLVCSNKTTRGNEGVVSFSQVPLEEFPQRRVFRKHLARWDFEPYGISINREWLRARGTKEVIYGDESVWSSLPEQRQPFFQVRRTGRDSDAQQPIDWTEEQEWRHVGDVELDELPSDLAVVFVPDRPSAEHIARISRWPVIVLRS